jgi:hypothetical protein
MGTANSPISLSLSSNHTFDILLGRVKMSNKLEKSISSIQQQEDPASSITPLYSHTFFSKDARAARKALIPGLVLPLIYNAILLWACLSLFFGSLIKSSDISKISVTAVNLDSGFFGSELIGSIKDSTKTPGSHLQWDFIQRDTWVNDTWSIDRILEERSWAVLQISSNASSNLRTALEQGNSSYNPLSAVTLYFASARNQVTTLSLTVPAVLGLVNPIVSQIATNTTAAFLQSNEGRVPPAALQCPQCLTTPFAIKQTDLIPFSSAVAFGTLNTGLIFVT